MTARALSPSALAVLRDESLSRREQGRRLRVSPQRVSQLVRALGLPARCFHESGIAAVRREHERRLHGAGVVYVVRQETDRIEVTVGSAVLRGIGARPGDHLRFQIDDAGRLRIQVERSAAA